MTDGPSPTGVGHTVDAGSRIEYDNAVDASVPVNGYSHQACAGVGAVTVVATSECDDVGERPDSQSSAIDVGRWGRLLAASLERLGERGEASLTFVDRATIAELNAEHMGADGPTDVLSFPLDAVSGDRTIRDDQSNDDHRREAADAEGAPRLLGDIVICADVAADNAPLHAGTFEDELALLVVHGALHLLGYDHAARDEAVEMRSLEADLLMELFWMGPAPERFRHEHADETESSGRDRAVDGRDIAPGLVQVPSSPAAGSAPR